MSCLDTIGRIFDIQRYSIHDGAGIRTIIFLKGCVLRCRWCCNPESQEYAVQTRIIEGKPVICGRDISVREVMAEAELDRPYYRRSGGGITLSGGESLCQPDFTRDLLRAAKEKGINTAMESMGCADFAVIEQILPWLDTYLFDIKHIDGEKHRLYTGRDNRLMLENVRRVADTKAVETVIRVPVIPGFNATCTEIRAIAEFADKLPGVKHIHLLPYHRLGQDKYVQLGRNYLMGDILPPDMDTMDMLKKTVEAYSRLDCHIGG